MTFHARSRSAALAALLLLTWAQSARADGKWVVVIGDSLSEENAFMIDALGRAGDIGFSSPDSDPTDANTANWVEILANWRNIVSGPDFLYFGS